MKRLMIFTMVCGWFLISASPAFAQGESYDEYHSFVSSTAMTMEQGRLEVGIFGPLRYGLTDKLELSSHPIWFLAAPNIRAKYAFYRGGALQLSWNSGLTYPTPLLRLLSMEGAGGIHPPDRAVPHIISIFNELVVTGVVEGHLVTGGLGLQVAPRFGESQMVSIDVPVVYARTAAFFTVATAVARVEVQGPIVGPIGYRSGLKGFIYPGADGRFTIEGTGQLRWQSSPRWLVQAGYLASYGEYPFGDQFRILPTLDVVWAW